MSFKVEVKSSSNGLIKKEFEKIFYSADDFPQDAKRWIREGIPTRGVIDVPQQSSGVVFKETGEGRMLPNAFGYFHNNSNDMGSAGQSTVLTCSGYSAGHGCSVTAENFSNVIAMFTARKVATQNWINDKDQFLVPNTSHEKYDEYTKDSLIFSLFNTSSQQTSIRGVSYKGKGYNIFNEFFFLSVDDVKSLADKYSNTKMYEDISEFGEERFVYTLIKGIQEDTGFSPEAKEVYEKAIELFNKVFPLRQAKDSELPHLQLNNWDAGWYQIKELIKELSTTDKELAKEYQEFRDSYNKLKEKLEPIVYELGFLLK